jgi:hypothetical protein
VLAVAAEGQKNVRVVDMTDAICGPDLCAAVVGNMIVWRDNGHLTATYSLALAPYLAPRLGFDAISLGKVLRAFPRKALGPLLPGMAEEIAAGLPVRFAEAQ